MWIQLNLFNLYPENFHLHPVSEKLRTVSELMEK